MRFLFVYQDYAVHARRLLEEVSIGDVTLIVARKHAKAPTPDEISVLNANKGADAAACAINRKYQGSIAPLVTLSFQSKQFRFDDQQLRQWLVPKGQEIVKYGKPRDTFLLVTSWSPHLVLHPEALAFADDLLEQRWGFVARAADLLGRYANGEPLGPNRYWKTDHGVDFAPNGRVSYQYRVAFGSVIRDGRTEWHLKEGDNTTRENAARIYFDRLDFGFGARVIVFYVGPHPEDGERSVSIQLS